MILLEAEHDRRFSVSRLKWPMIVHGRAGAGASMATVVMAAELIRSGESVVWMCAKPTAIRTLRDELGLETKAPIRAPTVSAQQESLADAQLVTMHGKSSFLETSLRALPDWQSRVVIVKNIEDILSPTLWSMIADHPRLILSGDVGSMPWPLPHHGWQSALAFSAWPPPWSHDDPIRPPFIGYLRIGRSHPTAVIIAESR